MIIYKKFDKHISDTIINDIKVEEQRDGWVEFHSDDEALLFEISLWDETTFLRDISYVISFKKENKDKYIEMFDLLKNKYSGQVKNPLSWIKKFNPYEQMIEQIKNINPVDVLKVYEGSIADVKDFLLDNAIERIEEIAKENEDNNTRDKIRDEPIDKPKAKNTSSKAFKTSTRSHKQTTSSNAGPSTL